LALTLGGKKRKLTRAYFERFGHGLGLNQKQIQGVFKRFEKNKPTAIHWINQSFLSQEMKNEYLDLLEERYRIFIV
jgi:serine/threonine-protein kinase HipA